jgi:ubiquinone/menaquinone biosynthesis C-methylase UbiE
MLGMMILVLVIAVVATGWWWRYRSLVCPAGLSWLVENPIMEAIAGAELIFQRIGLHEGMRLLDIGCGAGRLTIPAALRVGASGEVAALDIQQKMLEKLHQRIKTHALSNVHPIHGAAGSGMLEQGYYDRALLVTVLGEIHYREVALQEILAALKPGGLLSVTEVLFDPHYLRQHTLSALCTAAGFREVETFRGRFSYTKNFLRPAD